VFYAIVGVRVTGSGLEKAVEGQKLVFYVFSSYKAVISGGASHMT